MDKQCETPSFPCSAKRLVTKSHQSSVYADCNPRVVFLQLQRQLLSETRFRCSCVVFADAFFDCSWSFNRSLASFRPRPVAPRTALITATLFAPAFQDNVEFSFLFNSFSRPATTATAAAAETPNFSSIAETSSTTSITDIAATASGFDL